LVLNARGGGNPPFVLELIAKLFKQQRPRRFRRNGELGEREKLYN